MEPDYIAAHKHSSRHRQEILESELCGCFRCLALYAPDQIDPADWIDEDENGVGQTARCPVCGIDSVIGSKSGYPVDFQFLIKMEKHWFGLIEYGPDGNPR